MGKTLENKLKKLLQSTKPEKLARQWKNYMKDAYNEYYDNYNKEYSLKLLENGVKFLEENKHKSSHL